METSHPKRNPEHHPEHHPEHNPKHRHPRPALTWDFEMSLSMNAAVVAGVDEVGRGCLAGPVYAAAVVLGKRELWSQLNDSKKLTKLQREQLYRAITTEALGFAVASASVTEIDRLNILHASRLAMARAVLSLQEQLGDALTLVLVDGQYEPLWPVAAPVRARAVVGGDAQCPSIAAASIVAKVERDAYMCRLAERLPGYGFEHNVGYGTAEHLSALKALGPTIHHRRSFGPVAEFYQTGLSFYG